MHILDLTFSDGRACRCIVMEPTTDEEDQNGIRSIFHDGYLTGIERRIPECPEKLPWRRVSPGQWTLHRFTLSKHAYGWLVEWPGGSVSGGKDEVSAAVRKNWVYGS